MDPKILEIGFAVLAVVLMIAVHLIQDARLQNPHDLSVVYVDQLPGLIRLSEGPVEAVLVRQSGNLYRELGRFSDWHEAFGEIMKSFNRARIEGVMILENNSSRLDVRRHIRSQGGKAEGKKLGGAIIQRI